MIEARTDGDERVRLSRTVADRLVDMIAARELREGDNLPSEAELARRFNVSKPTVREALKRLAAYGVVATRQGKPSTIRPLGPEVLEGFFRLLVRSRDEGLREAVELRRAIETGIAELAAARATTQDLLDLRRALERMAGHVDTLDPWLEADLAFHQALARCSRNELMAHTVEGMAPIMHYTMRLLGTQLDLRDVPATLARHAAIVAAVEARDAAAARRAMQAHFDAATPVVSAIAGDRSRLARL